MAIFYIGSIGFVPLLLTVALFVWLGKHGFFDEPSEEAGSDVSPTD